MIDISAHTINYNDPISLALEKLNLPYHLRTVFVLNSENQVLGTITDGDIRRGLLNGIDFNQNAETFAFKNFKFIEEGQVSIEQFRIWREKQIFILPLLNSKKELIDILNFNQLKSYLPLTAVIMAGGFGNRLRPLTINTPKPMLKVGDLPILEINIRRLIAYGIKDIFICVNYLKDQIKDHFGNGTNLNCHIQYIEENEPLGTIGALSLIPEINTKHTLLFNADLLSNIDFEEMYLRHLTTNADLSIATIPHKVTLPYAVLENEGINITAIAEKPTYTYFANAGFYLFNSSLIDTIPQNIFYNATDFADQLIGSKKSVVSFTIHGYWNDIGSLDDYQKSNEDFPTINFF
jgi:dTDP-glucose pyrophosphorylase